MRRVLYLLRQFGFDPIRLMRATRFALYYFQTYIAFRKKSLSSTNVKLLPSLNDFNDSAGSADGHYFWQDLICAKWINESGPLEHLDVGSRVDGFIAHLLASRNVTLLDIRPLHREIQGLTVILGDIQNPTHSNELSFPSVSSLHSIEHFGLGRYKDPIDPLGHEKGLLNLANIVSEGGSLYVSFPIGIDTVEFNSQRIINPLWPQNMLKEFELQRFVLIPWKGTPIFNLGPEEVDCSIFGQAGLYHFKKMTMGNRKSQVNDKIH